MRYNTIQYANTAHRRTGGTTRFPEVERSSGMFIRIIENSIKSKQMQQFSEDRTVHEMYIANGKHQLNLPVIVRVRRVTLKWHLSVRPDNFEFEAGGYLIID